MKIVLEAAKRASQPLKFHGGKSYLAKWILPHFPSHTHYLEPFFGGGSVLLAKDPEDVAESVNDLDNKLTTFWSVLRNPATFSRLALQLAMTPCSDESFWASQFAQESTDPVMVAAGYFVRNRLSRQGLAKDYATPTRRTRRGMNETVSAYLSAVDGLPEVHERLRRVEIRNMHAVEFIRKYDHDSALFYCDPPYVASTRTAKDAYRHEMSDAMHRELLETLACISGRFVLSGYWCELYGDFAGENGWRVDTIEIDNKAGSGDVKRKMVEYLWMNF